MSVEPANSDSTGVGVGCQLRLDSQVSGLGRLLAHRRHQSESRSEGSDGALTAVVWPGMVGLAAFGALVAVMHTAARLCEECGA